MGNELSELEKTLQRSKKDFLATAKRATNELDRQRKRLRAEISRANARAKRARLQLQKKTERLANTTANKADIRMTAGGRESHHAMKRSKRCWPSASMIKAAAIAIPPKTWITTGTRHAGATIRKIIPSTRRTRTANQKRLGCFQRSINVTRRFGWTSQNKPIATIRIPRIETK